MDDFFIAMVPFSPYSVDPAFEMFDVCLSTANLLVLPSCGSWFVEVAPDLPSVNFEWDSSALLMLKGCSLNIVVEGLRASMPTFLKELRPVISPERTYWVNVPESCSPVL